MEVAQDNFDSKKFDVAKAYRAKQAAYSEVAESQEKLAELKTKLDELYINIGTTQEQYNLERDRNDAEWSQYNAGQLQLKADIGKKITSIKECNALAENFRLMSENEDEDPDKALVYADGSKFFTQLALTKMREHDEMISKKRAMIRPDNSRADQLLASLKAMRAEQKELLEEYHIAKNIHSSKKANLDRLQQKYERVRDGSSDDDTSEFSARPKRLEPNERLFVLAGIPEKYWDHCSIEQRADGKIDFYYGGTSSTNHGHVILADEEVIYSRDPLPRYA